MPRSVGCGQMGVDVEEGGGGARSTSSSKLTTATATTPLASPSQERLTLKHKNTSRWARRALRRGQTLMDEGTRQAVADQLRLGEELRKRVGGLVGWWGFGVGLWGGARCG